LAQDCGNFAASLQQLCRIFDAKLLQVCGMFVAIFAEGVTLICV
jgi:hypothetical protein